VVAPVFNDRFIGGTAIVAAHAKGLGAKVDFISVVGNDANADYLKEELDKCEVRSFLLSNENRPTIHKQRYRTEGKTLLRVNNLRQHSINDDLSNRIYTTAEKCIKNADLMIIPDFNYGMIHQEPLNNITAFCVKYNIPLVADSQSSSQSGDVSRFKYMRILTPTEHEARLALRDKDSRLVVIAEKLRKVSKADNIIVTRGKEGILIHAGNHVRNKKKWLTDKIPALNKSPKDVAGEGDSLLTCASIAHVCGADIWQSALLGSIAAACQTGRIGNIPLKSSDILNELYF